MKSIQTCLRKLLIKKFGVEYWKSLRQPSTQNGKQKAKNKGRNRAVK